MAVLPLLGVVGAQAGESARDHAEPRRFPLTATTRRRFRISEIVMGVVTYLLLDVQTPPPRVYLSNAKVYSQLVHSAGGHVLLKFLKYAGWPTLAHLSTFIAHVPQMPKDRVGSTRTTTISSGPWPTSRTTSPSRSSSSPPTRRSTPSSGRLSTSPSRSRRSGACGQQRVPGPLHGSKCIEHAFARWIQL